MEKTNIVIYRLINNSPEIIKIFDNADNVVRDGFGSLKKNNKINEDLFWEELSIFKSKWSPEIVDNYSQENSAKLCRVIKSNLEGEVLEIFDTIHDIPKISTTSITKQLLADSMNKSEYRKGYWWRAYSWQGDTKLLDSIDSFKTDDNTAINIILTISKKIISVNDMYKAKIIYARGRPLPSIYKNPAALQVAGEIRDQLLAVDFSKYLKWLSETESFAVTFSYVLKSGITRRDVDNFSKLSCDTIVSHFKKDLGIANFDDARFTEIHMYKSINPSAKNEYICVQLKKSNHNLRFDIIPEPTKLFISNSVGKSWKIDLINSINKTKLSYYDPENDLWDDLYVNKERNNCDTEVFILELNKIDFSILPEIIQIAKKCAASEYNFLYLGFLGECTTIEDEIQLKTLENIIKLSSEGSNRIIIRKIVKFDDLFSKIN